MSLSKVELEELFTGYPEILDFLEEPMDTAEKEACLRENNDLSELLSEKDKVESSEDQLYHASLNRRPVENQNPGGVLRFSAVPSETQGLQKESAEPFLTFQNEIQETDHDFTLSAGDFVQQDPQTVPGIEQGVQKETETEKEIEKPSPAKKILRILSDVLLVAACIILVAGSALFAFSNDPQKSYFGYRFYNVLSNSMKPQEDSLPGGFVAGDIIIVKMSDPSEIQIGDIITFVPGRDSRAYLTHRVVDIKEELNGVPGEYFVTRGDANDADDPPIAADMLIGKKVFSIPVLGSFIQFIRSNLILSLVFILAAFAFIIVIRKYFAAVKNGGQANT